MVEFAAAIVIEGKAQVVIHFKVKFAPYTANAVAEAARCGETARSIVLNEINEALTGAVKDEMVGGSAAIVVKGKTSVSRISYVKATNTPISIPIGEGSIAVVFHDEDTAT